MVDTEDISLIKKCQKGSEDAFKRLVEKYQRQTYWIAYNLLNDYYLAQDISQEAFIRVFKAIKRFDLSKSFYTWLYQIVVNLCIDRLRKRNITKEVGTEDVEVFTTGAIKNPIDKIEKGEISEQVKIILDKLPLKYKTVLVLRDIEGFPCEDIAEITNCPNATVRWRIHRARMLFKALWNGEIDKVKETEVGGEL